ncbi:MAG: hypothetical protein F9K47_17785 [Burkholderiales bacterium]|nr:MAG: hypothetical protein F9K47_17785 [Burkholderiales bacterium]
MTRTPMARPSRSSCSPAPARWLRFLQTLWPDDPETIAALQEWFGLLLTDETRYQKALALIGPRRSGKGTILRVLQRVAGDANIVAPTFSTLGLPFGLQPLIGKRVAVLSDARLSARADVAAVAENLLRITGEDCVSIPRKFLSDWHGRLPTRFVLASNELPAFCDASAALSSRFVILRLETSFLGREDHALSDALLVEAPAIFSWALGGLGRLQRRGKLLQPASGRELCQELEASASPIGEFVRDRCAVAPGAAIECGTLFDAWRAWCQSQGRDHPGTASSFARQLHASVPGLRTTQPRVNGARQRFFEGIRLDAGTRWNA